MRALGLDEKRVDEAARKAALASSMKGNPVVLEHDRLVAILMNALGG